MLSSEALGKSAPNFPFPQHITYAPGTIRPNHVDQTLQDKAVQAYYDAWKTSYLIPAGANPGGFPLYRISFGKTDPLKTVSEGQGFGMVIVALMAGYDGNARTYFDGLWRFAKAHPSRIDKRLMAWQVPDVATDQDSAFDGDTDMAYGLLLASRQWGNCGAINYQAEALKLIGGIQESTIGPSSFLPLLGDWVNPDAPQYNQWTPRSSDFILDHFRAFRRVSGSPKWDWIVSQSQKMIGQLQKQYSPATGLLPDFIVPVSSTNHAPQPAQPNFLESNYDGDYYYNAGRVPWRLGADALLNNDANSLAYTRKISRWAALNAAGDPQQIKAGYFLNGTPLPGSDYFTIFFVAPLGVAAMTDNTQQTWLNNIYEAVYNVHEDYFEDSVTLLSLLVMTGNYWDPSTR
ncbi:MAG: glycosyl hydrolase family 8 [Methylococcaceae bacterium]|nr:glycosyl hydrolase family 8 [Methylococcaceae bacterium]